MSTENDLRNLGKTRAKIAAEAKPAPRTLTDADFEKLRLVLLEVGRMLMAESKR